MLPLLTQSLSAPAFKPCAAFLVLLLVCLLSGSASEAADWVLLLEDDTARYYADRETAAKKGDVQEARELTIMKKHPEISRTLEVAEYDCTAGKRHVIQTLTYNNNGEVMLIPTVRAPWQDFGQDSRSKAFIMFSCGK